MKAISYDDFKKVYKDSDREEILKQFYYDYELLIEFKSYRLIIQSIINYSYTKPNKETKRFIDEIIERLYGKFDE